VEWVIDAWHGWAIEYPIVTEWAKLEKVTTYTPIDRESWREYYALLP
jgi:hypothetical protein